MNQTNATTTNESFDFSSSELIERVKTAAAEFKRLAKPVDQYIMVRKIFEQIKPHIETAGQPQVEYKTLYGAPLHIVEADDQATMALLEFGSNKNIRRVVITTETEIRDIDFDAMRQQFSFESFGL